MCSYKTRVLSHRVGNYLLLHYFFPEVVMQSKMIPCRNSCLVHFVSCVLRIKLMLWLFGLCDKYHELPLPFFSSFLLTVIYVLLSCELSLSLSPPPSFSASCTQLCSFGHEPADDIRREGEKRGTRRGRLFATRQP